PLGAEGAREVLFQVCGDVIIVEQRVINVEEEYDRMGFAHCAVPVAVWARHRQKGASSLAAMIRRGAPPSAPHEERHDLLGQEGVAGAAEVSAVVAGPVAGAVPGKLAQALVKRSVLRSARDWHETGAAGNRQGNAVGGAGCAQGQADSVPLTVKCVDPL